VRYAREVFSSQPGQVLVVRLTCDRPGRLFFDATLTRGSDSRTRAVGTDRVMIEGEAVARGERHQFERKVGVKFCGVVQALAAIYEGRRRLSPPGAADGVVRVRVVAGRQYRIRFD